MKIYRMPAGMLRANCYIAVGERKSGCFIVDPGGDAERIAEKIEETGATPEAVLLTHGHFDHIMAAEALRERYKIPVYVGEKERELLADPVKNLSGVYAEPAVLSCDRELSDGEKLTLAGLRIEVIETPGHSEGSVCYYLPKEQVLFSGDTLFQESYGKVENRASAEEIRESIIGKLFRLPDDTIVYPGHMDCTTIRHEKVYNPIYYML